MESPLTARYGRGSSPNAGPWTGIEEQSGAGLPQDYKELIRTFGGGRFDGDGTT